MTVTARILGQSAISLWGLDSRERLARQLRALKIGDAADADQVLLLLTTTTQADNEAPYALQAAKLTWSELRPGLLADVKKGLVKQPTIMQLASKPCSLMSTSVVSFCVLCLQETKDSPQEVDDRRCAR